MFVLLQLPFVDLRRIHEGELGRSSLPDWRADDPGRCFVRKFGGMVTRNAEAYGLVGERAYVEFEHALAFPAPGRHRQDGWSRGIPLRLWFRRLYFDGDISGRFEIGFNTEWEAERDALADGVAGYDLSLLGRTVLDIPVEVRSADSSTVSSPLGKCGRALGLAYLVATTLHSKRDQHPAAELLGTALQVGPPALHVRARADVRMTVPHDRRDIVAGDVERMFLTSVAGSQRRNTMTVQVSRPGGDETPHERARRVLFAHLNAVLFANDFLTGNVDLKTIARHRLGLRDLTERAIARFAKLTVTAPETKGDNAFSAALKVFADANANRIDELVDKLQSVAKDASAPGRFDRIGTWFKGWTEFTANAAIEAAVKETMKAG